MSPENFRCAAEQIRQITEYIYRHIRRFSLIYITQPGTADFSVRPKSAHRLLLLSDSRLVSAL